MRPAVRSSIAPANRPLVILLAPHLRRAKLATALESAGFRVLKPRSAVALGAELTTLYVATDPPALIVIAGVVPSAAEVRVLSEMRSWGWKTPVLSLGEGRSLPGGFIGLATATGDAELVTIVQHATSTTPRCVTCGSHHELEVADEACEVFFCGPCLDTVARLPARDPNVDLGVGD